MMKKFEERRILLKKTVKVLMSCKTADQLEMAVDFALLARDKYRKICRNNIQATQFALDMMYIADEVGTRIIQGNTFTAPMHNPFTYPGPPMGSMTHRCDYCGGLIATDGFHKRACPKGPKNVSQV